MASPFSIFRKHQRAMLAGLTILTVISFSFGTLLLQIMGERGGNAAVVSSKYGKLTEVDLSRLVRQRESLLHVLQYAFASANIDPNRALSFIGPTSEEAVVNGWLLSRRAEELGMVISDEAIRSALREWTNNALKWENLRKVLAQQQMSEYHFFQAMREELLAVRLQNIVFPSLKGDTPGQRWDYFTRLRRQATVEIVPVAVERFLNQIPDPDETTVTKFFEEHKDRIAMPDSPEPGFRVPQKVNVRYFKAEPDKFLSAVTDEEIKQEYESNRETYDKQEAAENKPPAAEKPVAEKPAAEEPAAEKPAAEAPSAEKTAPQAPAPQPKPAAEETPATAEKPAEKKAAAEKPAEKGEKEEAKQEAGEKDSGKETEKKAVEKKDDGGNAEKPAGAAAEKHKDTSDQEPEGEKSPDSGGASTARPASPFRLTAFLQDQPSQEKTDEPKEKAPAAEPKENAKPEKDAAKEAAKEETKDETKQREEKAAAEPSSPAGKAQNTAPQAAPAVSAEPPGGEGKPAEKAEKPAERPSARLKDQIRRKLAYAKIAAIFKQLQEQMTQYGNKWRIEHIKGHEVGPGPDLPALAEQNHLAWGETGLVAATQLQDSDIGNSSVEGHPFVTAVYTTSLLLYQPKVSMDLKGNGYLFWKAEETKEQVPTLAQPGVRQEVVRAWKMIEARKLAKKEAQRLADEARKAAQPLAEVFRGQADLHVSQTSPFSWLTFGNVPMFMSQAPPQISKVAGVEFAGNDFMRTVFHLTPGEVGAAMNAPETTAYVIRVVEVAPSDESLFSQFEAEPYWRQFDNDPYGTFSSVALHDRSQLYRAWLDELKSSANLKWAPGRNPERRGEVPRPSEEEPEIPEL